VHELQIASHIDASFDSCSYSRS